MERRLLQRPFSQGERRNGYRRVQKSIIGRNVRVGEVAKDVTLPDTCKKMENIPCFAGTNTKYRQKPRLAILILSSRLTHWIIDLPDQESSFLGSNVNLSNAPS